jgi:hypothetical protein
MDDGASASGLNQRLGTLSFMPASGNAPWDGIVKPDVRVFGLWEMPWCRFSWKEQLLINIFIQEKRVYSSPAWQHTTCCICISLSDGLDDMLGEVAEEDQGGVLLSPSEEGTTRADETDIGLERASEINEESRTRPALSGEFSKWSFALAVIGSFVFLCSLWISRREVGPFVIFTPPQAGPSFFGVTGTTGAEMLGFGVSSRAPLKNNDKPPFLFFFFDEVGWEGFFTE